MTYTTILGIIAAAMTTLCQLPQMIKTIKTKHTRDISLITYFTLTLGVITWLIYGLLIKDLPLIIANMVTVFLTTTILICKLKYK